MGFYRGQEKDRSQTKKSKITLGPCFHSCEEPKSLAVKDQFMNWFKLSKCISFLKSAYAVLSNMHNLLNKGIYFVLTVVM